MPGKKIGEICMPDELHARDPGQRNSEIHGFMPRQTGPLWTSRDFEMEIPCSNKDCFLNRFGTRCTSPASISIDNTGRCEMYLKELEHRKKGSK